MDSDRAGPAPASGNAALTSADPVRIALVGAGRMGRVHLDALRRSPAIELAGVVEPYAPTRESLAGERLAVYESVDELLDRDRPEGVLIAAPSDRHQALVAEFAAAGVPMLCEKPVGIRVSDALGATATAREAGVLLQVGYWRRFVPELRALRERISTGQLGDINQLACMQWDAEPPSDQFRAHSGGIAVDMGVHEFDQIRWLLGQEIQWVAAISAGPASGATASDPDAATVLAQLSGGAAATVSLGRRFPHADSCWLEVWGTEGYERLPFMWDAEGDRVFRTAIATQAEAFADAIRGGTPTGAWGEDAVAALTVAEWTAESLAESDERVLQTPQVAR